MERQADEPGPGGAADDDPPSIQGPSRVDDNEMLEFLRDHGFTGMDQFPSPMTLEKEAALNPAAHHMTSNTGSDGLAPEDTTTLPPGAGHYSPNLNPTTMIPNMVQNTHLAGPGWGRTVVTTAGPAGPYSQKTYQQPAPAITSSSSYAGTSSCMPAAGHWPADRGIMATGSAGGAIGAGAVLVHAGSVPGGFVPHPWDQAAAAAAAGPSSSAGPQQQQQQQLVPGNVSFTELLQGDEPMDVDHVEPMPPVQPLLQQVGMEYMPQQQQQQQQVGMVPMAPVQPLLQQQPDQLQAQQLAGMGHMPQQPLLQQQLGMAPMVPQQQQQQQLQVAMQLGNKLQIARAAVDAANTAAATLHPGALGAPRLKASRIAGELVCRTVNGLVTGTFTGYRCCVPLCGQPAQALGQTHICAGCFNAQEVDMGVGGVVVMYRLNKRTRRFELVEM